MNVNWIFVLFINRNMHDCEPSSFVKQLVGGYLQNDVNPAATSGTANNESSITEDDQNYNEDNNQISTEDQLYPI